MDLILGTQAVHHLAGVGGTQLLGGQQVDGDDEAHQQVLQKADRAHHAAGGGSHDRLGLGQHFLREPGVDIRVVCVELGHHPLLQRGVGLQQVLDPAADGAVIQLRVGDELEDALIQLRQQHGCQQVQQDADDRPGQQDAHRPEGQRRPPVPQLGRLGMGRQLLEKIHHRGQQIGHKAAVENGGNGGHELPPEFLKHPVAEQSVVKQQDGAHGAEHRQAHLDVFLSLRHDIPSCISLITILHGGTGNCNPVFPVIYCVLHAINVLVFICFIREVSLSWSRKNC